MANPSQAWRDRYVSAGVTDAQLDALCRGAFALAKAVASGGMTQVQALAAAAKAVR